MFDKGELTGAVEIQRRSYRLLRWIGEAIPRGFIRFERAHEYATEAEAAEEWIAEHYANLPEDCRPPARRGRELRRFANCLSSYLLTSFDLLSNPGTRLDSACGCYCSMCAYVSAAPHLRLRNPRAKDVRQAEQLKRLCMKQMADDAGITAGMDALGRLLADQGRSREAAVVTYGVHLLRRCEGLATGPALLALWRQFAWTPAGSPRRGFELRAEDILEAEGRLLEALRSLG